MPESALLYGLLAALGGGLLVGVERERSKGTGPERDAIGARTCVLAALTGTVCTLLGDAALVLGGLAVAGFAGLAYRRSRARDPGLTSEIALLLVYLLGALAATRAQLAAGLYVLVAIVLASKPWLHRFTRQSLGDAELDDLLLLAASALIVLPLLPDRAVDAFGVLNPRTLWLLVVLVMAINAAGYVALRVLGARRGLLLAGFLGGFVSSTATIGGMGQRAGAMPEVRDAAIAAALLSNIPTVVQIGIILAATSPPLLLALAPALVAAGAVAAALAAVFVVRARAVVADTPAATGSRPFDLRHALLFAAIVAAALLLAAALHAWIGERGALIAATATGLADVHAATVSLGELAATATLPVAQAALGLVLAFFANSLVKGIAALAAGGRAFAHPLAGSLVAIDAALLIGYALR
ncbi:MAG: MgtC/SapB family protein [Dokdonella sp.]|uniref:MgtC/SapB family protein n=1 Tax=Dokdonella sp. TaxID=2291710 RepID=UPI003F7DDC74